MDQLQERYLSPAELSKLTGIKEQTLANHRHQRRGLPYYRFGRLIKYKWSDVLDFMERTRIDPGKDNGG